VDSISDLGSLGSKAHIVGETIDLTRQPIQAKRTALLVFRLIQ
jgi:hypothetical protein